MQVFHLLAISTHTHLSRPRDLLLSMTGFALASAVLAVLLAVPSGLQRTAAKTGHADVVLALSSSAFDEASSTLTPQQVQLLGDLPHVARSPTGGPLLAPQFLGTTKIRGHDGQPRSIQVRGVDERTLKVLGLSSNQFNALRPGARTLLAGAMVCNEITGGQQQAPTVRVRNSDWSIAGEMEHAGSLWDSELWADLSTLQADYRSQSAISVVLLKLDSAENLQTLMEAARGEPRLRGIRLVRQDHYYQVHSRWLANLLRRAAIAVSVLLGIGAALAIGNALGTSFRARRRESGTLRALGFRNSSIVTAALVEVLAIGGLTSTLCLMALYIGLEGRQFSAPSNGSSTFFELHFDGGVLSAVFSYTLILGVAASFTPILKMCFGNLVEALRTE